MKTVLLVTWLVFGQSPSSYQVEFDAAEKCAQARSTVLLDYERMYGPIESAPRQTELVGMLNRTLRGALNRAAISAGRPIYEKPKISVVCVER